METTITVAVIGAAGVILAAVLPVLLQRKGQGTRNEKPHDPLPAVAESDIERQLRADDGVKRLLGNKNWKDAAEAAIKCLCRGEACKVDSWKTSSTWQQVAAVHAQISTLADGGPMNAADRLFQRLLKERRKISYIGAYEILLGNRPNPWRNMPHCREVLAVAQQSMPQGHGSLTVQLDALIVNQDGNHEPSDGYFMNRGFTREQWRSLFGEWPLL